MADGPSILDQAMGTDQQPKTASAAPAAAAPAAGGSVLDQAIQSTGQEAKDTAVATTPESPYSWLERAEGAVAQQIPVAEDNTVLSWVNKHIVQPPVRMGEETGKILSNRGLKALAYGEQAASDISDDLFGGKRTPLPSWAKGMEGDYLKQKFEEASPRVAGVASSAFNFLGNIVGNPTNWPLMGTAAAKSALLKTFTKAFGAEMGAQAIESGKNLWDNWENMTTEERWKAMTDLTLQTATARQALKGHGTAQTPEVKATPSKTIAGVTIPLSEQHAEAVSGPKNMPLAETEASLHAVKEQQRLQTAPAATSAMHSVLGQSAEDLINQHDSIRNAEPLPEQVAGSNNPSKYQTIDDASTALNEKARSTTYAKADEISAREQAEHQQKVQSALSIEKAGVDHYNQMVEEHNSSLGENEEPMQKIAFDPSKITTEMEAQRPKTYGELKGAVDRAYQDLKSPDAEIREQAVDDVDKSEKQLDQWFKQHSDEISPEEYTSAKKLVYAGARFQEIANGLRSGIENDNLSGNKLRSIIASIDNRMIKRGESPGAFRRLVGDDVYQNWRDVARLFDPINKAPMGARTIGRLALHFAAHHFFGPLGFVGKVGMHFLMDRVLSSPEWGSWFKDMADSVKQKYQNGTEIPGRVLEKFKALWDGSRQEGAAGAKVTPRTVGTPVPPKFGRGGLGGSVLDSALGDEQVDAHNENGGSTFDMQGKNLNGVDKYSVGSYPERTETHDTLDSDTLQAFKDKNADVLKQPNHAVGTWKDGDKHVLDVSKLYDNREEAVEAGRTANQKSIYHLGSGELIDTGGTGEVPAPTRKWPTGDALIKKYGSTSDPAHAAFLLPDGRNVAQTGTEHDRMLGGTPKDDLRTPYVNETGTIRMRAYGAYGDRQFGISLPESGITHEQLEQLEKWAPQMRTGRIFLEVARPEGAHTVLEQGSRPDLTAEIKRLVPIKGETLPPNASGESAASQEALNRQGAEKAQGIQRVKVLRDGREVPLIGPDAVDATAGPGETVVKRYADGHEEIQDQGPGARYNPRDPQAEALKQMSATNDNNWMAQAREKLGPDATISQVAMEAARLKTQGTQSPAEKLEASEIATRRPTSTRVEKTNASGQYADMDGVRAAALAQPGGNGKLGYAEKLARTISKYSGIDYTDEQLGSPRVVMEKFINHLTNNLVALHDAMPEQMRETSRQWYDTAHQMSKTMAEKYGISHEQAAGVLAALSPQNAWDNNVALGDRLLDAYKNRQNFEFSPKMEAAIAKVKGGQLSKAGRGVLKDIQGKTLAEIADQPMPERLRKKWGSEADNKWANVKAAQQGMWIRLYDEAHNAPENPMFHPSGEVVGVSPNNRSWIGLDHVAKAIRIINDGRVESINDVMGDGNKIRNFYNNIINPDSKNGHVTVDTHAVGAAHFQPFSGDDAEVQHNFGNTPKGIPGAPKHAATGMRGTYPLYAEAYRRAAEKLGVKPRELQSMTWEGIRSLMGDNKKTPEIKALARDVWQKVQEKELTPRQAREMIIEQAGGFSKPSWMTDEQWDEAMGTGFDPDSFAAAGGSK